VKLRALLDSGATQTLVAAPGMARLQLGPRPPERDRNEIAAAWVRTP